MRETRYPVIIERTATSYSAYSPDVSGCAAVGDTIAETRRNFQDALAAHFEAMREIGEPVPEPSASVDYGREEDGRWWADIESMPGVMAYGDSRKLAVTAVRALALRVVADCIDHHEEIPASFETVFSIALANENDPKSGFRRS